MYRQFKEKEYNELIKKIENRLNQLHPHWIDWLEEAAKDPMSLKSLAWTAMIEKII